MSKRELVLKLVLILMVVATFVAGICFMVMNTWVAMFIGFGFWLVSLYVFMAVVHETWNIKKLIREML